jgi:hypothetical protein
MTVKVKAGFKLMYLIPGIFLAPCSDFANTFALKNIKGATPGE